MGEWVEPDTGWEDLELELRTLIHHGHEFIHRLRGASSGANAGWPSCACGWRGNQLKAHRTSSKYAWYREHGHLVVLDVIDRFKAGL